MLSNIVTISPDIQSGAPVFTHTRVPIKNLFDYLKAGDSLEDFLRDFPSVQKGQVLSLLTYFEHLFVSSDTSYENSAA